MKVVKPTIETTVEFEPGDVVRCRNYVWVRLNNGNWAVTDISDGWQEPDCLTNDDSMVDAYNDNFENYVFLTEKD